MEFMRGKPEMSEQPCTEHRLVVPAGDVRNMCLGLVPLKIKGANVVSASFDFKTHQKTCLKG